MIKRLVLSFSIGLAMFGFVAAAGPSQPALACVGQNVNFLGFIPPWHAYLECDETGGVNNESFRGADGSFNLGAVWLIALAVFEGLIRVGGLVAMIFIIWGGFKYITSNGNPEGTSSARKTIINAIAGLIITISASVLVSFVFNILNGGAGFGQAGVGDEGDDAIERVFSLAYAVIAVVAVIYVVIGSIKFATSTGDPQKAANARNTIIYAIVGLIVVVAANIITSAVLGEVNRGQTYLPIDISRFIS